jgi:hypothetical protein
MMTINKKLKVLLFGLCMTSLLFCATEGLAQSNVDGIGDRTHGGGTEVISPEGKNLPADVFYQRSEHGFFTMGEHLISELNAYQMILYKLDLLDVQLTPYLTLKDFFNSYIFDESKSQYVVTNSLPSQCIFIPQEKILSVIKVRKNVACTSDGGLTYLLGSASITASNGQKVFQLAMDPQIAPAIILHERLIAFSPKADYEIITGIVGALYTLRNKVFDINGNVMEGFALSSLTTEERNLISGLTYYINRLAGSKKIEDIWLNEAGVFINGKTRLNHPNLQIAPGSILLNTKIESKNAQDAHPVLISNSSLADSIIENNLGPIEIKDSNTSLKVAESGDIRLENVNFNFHVTESSQIFFNNTKKSEFPSPEAFFERNYSRKHQSFLKIDRSKTVIIDGGDIYVYGSNSIKSSQNILISGYSIVNSNIVASNWIYLVNFTQFPPIVGKFNNLYLEDVQIGNSQFVYSTNSIKLANVRILDSSQILFSQRGIPGDFQEQITSGFTFSNIRNSKWISFVDDQLLRLDQLQIFDSTRGILNNVSTDQMSNKPHLVSGKITVRGEFFNIENSTLNISKRYTDWGEVISSPELEMGNGSTISQSKIEISTTYPLKILPRTEIKNGTFVHNYREAIFGKPNRSVKFDGKSGEYTLNDESLWTKLMHNRLRIESQRDLDKLRKK